MIYNPIGVFLPPIEKSLNSLKSVGVFLPPIEKSVSSLKSVGVFLPPMSEGVVNEVTTSNKANNPIVDANFFVI